MSLLRDLPADPALLTDAESQLIARLTAALIAQQERAVGEAWRALTEGDMERLDDAERLCERRYAALVAIERYLCPVLRPFDLGALEGRGGDRA